MTDQAPNPTIVGRALHGAPNCAEAEIRALAAKHGIGAEPGQLDELASHINRLSDGDVSEPGEVRRLLSNLARYGVVAGRDATIMLARHLSETRS